MLLVVVDVGEKCCHTVSCLMVAVMIEVVLACKNLGEAELNSMSQIVVNSAV